MMTSQATEAARITGLLPSLSRTRGRMSWLLMPPRKASDLLLLVDLDRQNPAVFSSIIKLFHDIGDSPIERCDPPFENLGKPEQKGSLDPPVIQLAEEAGQGNFPGASISDVFQAHRDIPVPGDPEMPRTPMVDSVGVGGVGDSPGFLFVRVIAGHRVSS